MNTLRSIARMLLAFAATMFVVIMLCAIMLPESRAQGRARIAIPTVALTRPLSELEYTFNANFAATGTAPVVSVQLYAPYEFATNTIHGVRVQHRSYTEMTIDVTRQEAMDLLVARGVPRNAVTNRYDQLPISTVTNLYFSIAYTKTTNALHRFTRQ